MRLRNYVNNLLVRRVGTPAVAAMLLCACGGGAGGSSGPASSDDVSDVTTAADVPVAPPDTTLIDAVDTDSIDTGDADTEAPPDAETPTDAPDAVEPPDSDADVPVDAPDTVADTTAPPVAWSLIVPAGARSCELLVSDPELRVGGVDFADAVRGKSIRQGPLLAITFLRLADADFEPEAVTLSVTEGASPSIGLSRGACFDRLGAALSTGPVLP